MSNKKRRIFKAVFIILLVLHAALLFMGGATVITMLLFYSVIAWIAIYLNKRFVKPPTAQNIRLLIITTIVALVIAELFLRYVTQEYKSYGELNGNFIYSSERINRWGLSLIGINQHWIHTNDPLKKVDYDKPEFNFPGEYFNSLGLRERELSEYTGSNRENLVIGMGDSFTEGVGAPHDSAWLRQMERMLAEKGYHLNTLDAGISANDPLFDFMMLQYRLSYLEPKLVIVDINNTDITDIMNRGGFERFASDSTLIFKRPHWWEYLYTFSYINRNIVHKIGKLDWQFLTNEERLEAEKNAKHTLIECIEKFKTYTAQQRFNLLVVFHPLSYEIVNQEFDLDDVCRQTDSVGVPNINLYSWYLAHGMNKDNVFDYYWKTDWHHNSKGYGLWAQAVAEKITANRLID